MTEPRMRQRQKGPQFPPSDLEAYLIAFGDARPPLAATVRLLDEIVTDFIIETCHEAAVSANYARRAKIKVDDFKFMLRRDPRKLGRVTELLRLDREFKRKRRAFDVDEGALVGKKGEDAGAGAAAAEGEDGERPRKRHKKAKEAKEGKEGKE